MSAGANIAVFLRDADGITARPINAMPDAAVVVLDTWGPIVLHVGDVRAIDRLVGALMDARRMLAPDDPASLVQVVASGEPVAEAPGGAS